MTKNGGHFDLIIIGGGVAGTHAALLAAKNGMKVAIIEKARLGGSSANYSDIPFAVLNEISKKLLEIKNSKEFGVQSSRTSYNFQTISEKFKKTVQNTGVTEESFYKNNKIEIFKGNAYFLSNKIITIGDLHLEADHFIVASGSKWHLPKIVGLSQINYLNPNSIVKLSRLPKSIYIIGGTTTAVFLAQTLSILGVKVYLTVKNLKLLPDYSEEINQSLEKYLRNYFDITISTSSRTLELANTKNKVKVLFSHAGVERELIVEKILIAEKLDPELDLGLNNANVEYKDKKIMVDSFLKTTNPNIFAAGNVLGKNYDSQISVLQAETAFYNLIHNKKRAIDYNYFPEIINLHPKVAKVGLNEEDCNKKGIKHNSVTVDYSQIPHSIFNEQDSFGSLKIIVNSQKQIIGAEIIGTDAEGIIHQLSMAIKLQLTPKQLLEVPTSFLSCYEIINIASNKLI